MKTRSSAISYTGDVLINEKISSTRGVSITEPHNNEICKGIEAIVALQGFEKAKEKLQPDVVETGNGEALVTQKAAETTELEESKTSIAGDKRNLKRKPKDKPTNPFWKEGNRLDHPLLPIPRPPRTVEIRGGDVLGQCECLKRNGLQHDCPKWDCRGEDLCLTWPIPTCQPSGLGVPIIAESRVKRPDPANCEMTVEEQKKAEKAAAIEKRKEEVRLIEQARSGWNIGLEQVDLLKTATQKRGYLKCNIHSGKYRLVPLMRDVITQTPDELCICFCDGMEHQETAQANTTKPTQPSGDQKEMSKEQAKAMMKNSSTMESVRTSTTGIPKPRQLKALIKP